MKTAVVSVWLVLTALAAFAAGRIVEMHSGSSAADGGSLLVVLFAVIIGLQFLNSLQSELMRGRVDEILELLNENESGDAQADDESEDA